MNRTQLDHLIRAARVLTGAKDIGVLGEAATPLLLKEPPEEACKTDTAEIYLERVSGADQQSFFDVVMRAIGPGTYFHKRYGYCARVVVEDAVMLPFGWRSRSKERNFAGGAVAVPTLEDIFLTKLARWSDADVAWLEAVRPYLKLDQLSFDVADIDPTAATAIPRAEAERRLEILLGPRPWSAQPKLVRPAVNTEKPTVKFCTGECFGPRLRVTYLPTLSTTRIAGFASKAREGGYYKDKRRATWYTWRYGSIPVKFLLGSDIEVEPSVEAWKAFYDELVSGVLSPEDMEDEDGDEDLTDEERAEQEEWNRTFPIQYAQEAAELKASLEEWSRAPIAYPIFVVREGPQILTLWAGINRLAAAVHYGLTEIPAFIGDIKSHLIEDAMKDDIELFSEEEAE